MQEMGITRTRLSCITGATKRLGFERRLDDRAFVGFLKQLALDASSGLDLLDDLELQMGDFRSEEHTSALLSIMRISYAVICLNNKTNEHSHTAYIQTIT